MNEENYKNLRVVIAAGGDGTRMSHISNGRPKSLLNIYGKPLISYQLELLQGLGLKNIMLSFNNNDEIREFKKIISQGNAPTEVNYTFSTHDPFDHPGKLFTSKETLDYIEGHDILYTHSDLVFEKSMIQNMFKIYTENKNCIVINTGVPKPSDKVQYHIKNNFIIDHQEVLDGQTTWRDGGLFIIPVKFQHLWLATFSGNPPSTTSFINNLLSNNIQVYVEPKCKTYININTEEDYNRALEYLGAE